MNDVRIICISGMVERTKSASSRPPAPDEFMHKPFEVEKLVRADVPTPGHRAVTTI